MRGGGYPYREWKIMRRLYLQGTGNPILKKEIKKNKKTLLLFKRPGKSVTYHETHPDTCIPGTCITAKYARFLDKFWSFWRWDPVRNIFRSSNNRVHLDGFPLNVFPNIEIYDFKVAMDASSSKLNNKKIKKTLNVRLYPSIVAQEQMRSALDYAQLVTVRQLTSKSVVLNRIFIVAYL